MQIIDLYEQNDPKVLSIELIPPRNGGSIEIIDKLVEQFNNYPIGFFSITWGAGGSLRGGTLPLTWRIKERHQVETMAHLTCRDFTVQTVENILMDAKYLGIENVLALRGDPPQGEDDYQFDESGYQYAYQLIEHLQNLRNGKYLKRVSDNNEYVEYRQGEPFEVCVCAAGYPEGHLEAPSKEVDWQRFKTKVDIGVDFAITQMVFNVDHYKEFIRWCRACDIAIPIIPGVFPLRRYNDLNKLPDMFGVTIPEEYSRELEKVKDNPDKFKEVSVDYTTHIVKEFLAMAPGIHFYSMNNFELVSRILDRIL